MNKVEQLVAEIQKRNQEYRTGRQTITDQEYDKLIDELKRIDPDNEWLKHIEPVKTSIGRKVKLPIPMKSLDKVKDIRSFKTWANSIGLSNDDEVVVMPKFDGLSLLHNESTGMTYSRGGADNEGQDCSAHYKAATGVTNASSQFKYTFGEFVFSCESWLTNFAGKTSPETGDKYKSPRNTAAGFINRDKPSENLKFIDFYRYGTDDESIKAFSKYSDFYEALCSTFNQPKLCNIVHVGDLTSELCCELYEKWSKIYYIDGLVIYANNISIWSRVGRQATTGNPNYAIAYKDPNFTTVFETTVKDVVWKISKSGAFKPVISIEAVNTGDCDMENPTGYNAKWVKNNHVAKGAKVVVTRSGGVIPKILEITEPAPESEEAKMWNELSTCPHCGSPTEWNSNGVELCCHNPNCCGIEFAKIVFFFKTLEAENIGEDTLSKIYNAGFTSLRKILRITFDELLDIESFGEATANQVLQAVNIIKGGVEITRLMHASDCFNGIGQVKAKAILSKMSDATLYAFYTNRLHSWVSNEELKNLDIFKRSNVTMQSFLLGLIPFYEFVAKNELTILPMEKQEKPVDGSMSGMKVCFTGVRDQQLEDAITSNGGEIVSGVSKKTTHLIVLDKGSQSSKAIKAAQYSIPIMAIDEFKSKFNL